MKQNEKEKDSAKGGSLSSLQFFNALNKYIPALVMQQQITQYQAMENYKNAQIQITKNGSSKVDVPVPKTDLPTIQEMETVCLFADISGFTNISEACSVLGIRGCEELAFCINRYMEGMAKNLAKYGGDIIKFVGDAMIVMWPRFTSHDSDVNEDDEKVTVIRKAIQCAFDIQKEMNNKKIMTNVTNLSVKIGIGFGKCALLYVGGVFNRSEFFTVGTAHGYALASEGECTSGGQIVVSNTAFKYVKNHYYDGVEITNAETGHKFYRVTEVKQGVRSRADAVLLKSSIKLDRMAGIQKSLRSCVPSAIMPYLEIGYEQYGSETRALTVMFASLGIDLNSAGTMQGINKIQTIVKEVQQEVYRLEGSVNKLVLDDKGSTLICIWGLSPLAHHDDPARAILAAFNMRRKLKTIDNTWCNVGIATGDVFSGVVGTSGSRKEFSCLGDSVNLAARIMFWPMKTGTKGVINCDLRTKNEAMNQITFKYGGHCEFKGKSISIPIFEPIDPLDEWAVHDGSTSGYHNKIIPPQVFLKLHYNPMIVQKTVNHKKYIDPFIGNNSFISEIYDKIKEFFMTASLTDKERAPLSIVIQGELGSGKTHAVRTLCEKFQRDQDFIIDSSNNQHEQNFFKNQYNRSQTPLTKKGQVKELKFPIFASTVNEESKMQFLGSWRPILRNMLEFKRQMSGQRKTKILKDMLRNNHDKIDIIFDIFGINSVDPDSKQKRNKMFAEITKGTTQEEQAKSVTANSPVHFLLGQKYDNQVTDQVLELIVDFIKEFLGEQDENSNSFVTSSEATELNSTGQQNKFLQPNNQKYNNKSFHSQIPAKRPCILIFDNVSLMDQESWTLVLRVYSQCSNICFLMIAGQDFKGNPILPKLIKEKQNPKKPTELQYNHDEFPIQQVFLDHTQMYDMPQLSKKDLKKILIDIAQRYQQTYQEEIFLMTEIKNPQKTIKTKEKSDWWVKELTKKWSVEKIFDDVEDQIVELIQQKCDGNVLICLQYFLNLIQNGFIEVNNRGLVVTKKSFDNAIQLNDMTGVPVPSSIHKRRIKNLDYYLKQGRLKGNQRKQEITVKGLMVMKAACIIGEEFGTAALKKILPLRHETHGSLYQILKELEIGELIEILDESDPKNIQCRFNKSFLRESIYQIMLYKDQKKVLHQQLAEHIQSLPSSVMDQKQIEIEIEKLRKHILIGEDCKTESELPFKQKYGLIVKQMQCMLIKNNNKIILYKNFVYKQGKKANKNISKRLLILTPKDISWFHNVQEYESNKQALGIIKVEDIFKVSETVMQSSTYDFDISVSEYTRKGVKEQHARTIKFGCGTENERHQWISRIEFLKAKTVYENYVNKFVHINFPLKKEEDVVEEDVEQQKDQIYEKLHQFGKNFKSNARINHNVIPTQLNRKLLSMTPSQQIGSNKLARRDSIASQSYSKIGQRSSRFEDMNDAHFKQMQENAISAQDLAKKIKNLYNASLVCVINTTTINANKSANIGVKNKNIGRLPDYFYPGWIDGVDSVNSKDFIFEQPKSTFEIDISKMAKNNSFQESSLKELKSDPPKPFNMDQLSPKSKKQSEEQPLTDKIHQINEESEHSQSHSDSKRGTQKRKNQSQLNSHKNKKEESPAQIPVINNKMSRKSVQMTSELQKNELRYQLQGQRDNSSELRTTNDKVMVSSQGKISGNSAAHVTQQIQMLEGQKKIMNKDPEINLNHVRQTFGPDQLNQNRFNVPNQIDYNRSDQSNHMNNPDQINYQRMNQQFQPNHGRARTDFHPVASNSMIGQIQSNNQMYRPASNYQLPQQFQMESGSQMSSIIHDQQYPLQNFSGYNMPHDFGYNYDRSGLQDRSGTISPMIQNEISNQINQGLKNFFINLDNKLEKQRQQGIIKKQSWSMAQLFNSGRQEGIQNYANEQQRNIFNHQANQSQLPHNQIPLTPDRLPKVTSLRQNSAQIYQGVDNSPLIPDNQNYQRVATALFPDDIKSPVSSRRQSESMSAYGSGVNKVHKHLRGQNNQSMTSKQTSNSEDDIEDPDSQDDAEQILTKLEIPTHQGNKTKKKTKK